MCADATTWRGAAAYDLAVRRLPAAARRASAGRPCAAAFAALRPGGTFLLVAHDTTNLTEGTGGPQDPAVLMTAEDVLADLAGERFEVVRAERVARATVAATGTAGEPDRTAWDCLVRDRRG